MCSREWGAAASSLLPVAVMKPCATTDQAHRGVQCSAVVHWGSRKRDFAFERWSSMSSLEQSLLIPLGVWVRANGG